jgi:hypothetical protein
MNTETTNTTHQCHAPITDASDPRIADMWVRVWDAFAGDTERDGLWQVLIEAIPGVPDLRMKRYGGTITLTFQFTDVQVDGDLTPWEIETAIMDAMKGDLNVWDADETMVEYEEE